MKNQYDMRFNSRGNIQPMNRGFFEKTAFLAGNKFNENDYTTAANDTAEWRIRKSDLATACQREKIESFLRKVGATVSE